MRKIKFRVWDDTRKVWDTGRDNELFFSQDNDEEGVLKFHQPKLTKYRNYVIEQFTGVKDKNGREIYEGDIINSIMCIGVCTYSENEANFWVNCQESDITTFTGEYWGEVIGNIHENPELLKGKMNEFKSKLLEDECTVVHYLKNDYDVYIGRPSKWGNPFIIGKDGTREEVIQKYKEWIETQPDLMYDLKELKGKRLGCHCKPESCHGDVIAQLVNEL